MNINNYQKLNLNTHEHIDLYLVNKTHHMFDPQEIKHFYQPNKSGGDSLFVQLKGYNENHKQIIEIVKFDDDHLIPYKLLNHE